MPGKKTKPKTKPKPKTKAVQTVKQDQLIIPPQDNMQLEINPQALIEAAMSKKVDISIIEKFLDMRDRLKAEQAKQAFREAMSHFQANCPIIIKTKPVMNKDKVTVRYKFAPLDVIVKEVQSLIGDCGLSYDIDTIVSKDTLKIEIIISHVLGHSKKSSFEVPIGTEDYMTAPQKYAARRTFALRYAFLNGFGILTGDLDTDDGGNDNIEPEAAPEVDTEVIMKKASDLVESSQTLKQLNDHGAEIKNIIVLLTEHDSKIIREQYVRRQKELMAKEKK